MSRVVHFEVAADDHDRAKAFYASAFGWQTQSWDGPTDYTFLITGERGDLGIDGALVGRSESSPPVVLTLGVADVEETQRLVEQAGGKVVRGAQLVEGVGHLAYVEDTEGNLFGVMQFLEEG